MTTRDALNNKFDELSIANRRLKAIVKANSNDDASGKLKGAKAVKGKPSKVTRTPKFVHFTATEKALVAKWRNKGMSLGKCAELLGRSKEAIRDQTTPPIVKKKAMKKCIGRPDLGSEAK